MKHQKPKTSLTTLLSAWTLALTTVCLVMLCSCNTGRSAQRKITNVQLHHPDIMATACAAFYPVADSAVINTVYKEGIPVYLKDTVNIHEHSVTQDNTFSEEHPVEISHVPFIKLRVDTVFINNYKRVVDRAAEYSLKQQLQDATTKLAKDRIYLLWAKWLVVALITYVLIRLLLKP